MKIVIPMAGIGYRFLEHGYNAPKPLIKVAGRMIIEHVLDMFESTDEFVFICNEIHLTTTTMAAELRRLVPRCTIVSMPAHKKGPVFTVRAAYAYIQDDEEVMIVYCDGVMRWRREDFQRHVDQNALDGCLFTHTGFHPHTLSSTKMAFLREQDGLVAEVKEKASYTDNPMAEHASSGMYYFRRGQYIKDYFEQALGSEQQYRGEYYITLVYNLLIRDRLRVGYYDTTHVAILGTPEEVRNFEAWATVLGGHQVRGHADALRCYDYWAQYHRCD